MDVFFFDLNQHDFKNTTFTMVNILAIFHIIFILTQITLNSVYMNINSRKIHNFFLENERIFVKRLDYLS